MLLATFAVAGRAEEPPALGSPPRVLKELLAKGVIQGVPNSDFFSRVFGVLFRCGAYMVKPGEREPALFGECKLENGPYRYGVEWGLMSSRQGELEVFNGLYIRVAYLSKAAVPLTELYRQLPEQTIPTYRDHAGTLYRTDCGTAETITSDRSSAGAILVSMSSRGEGSRCTGTLDGFSVSYRFPQYGDGLRVSVPR